MLPTRRGEETTTTAATGAEKGKDLWPEQCTEPSVEGSTDRLTAPSLDTVSLTMGGEITCHHGRRSTFPLTRPPEELLDDGGEASPGLCHRSSSATSSILYAGVEQRPTLPPARPASRAAILQRPHSPAAETAGSTPIQSPSSLQSADRPMALRLIVGLDPVARGGWLYKYPRRSHGRLYRRAEIPRTYLTHRYFQLLPHSGRLLWSERLGSSPAKQVRIVDFLTETRRLPAEEGGRPVTILVVITDEGSPVVLVPATREDLHMWCKGFEALLELRRAPGGPAALGLCLCLEEGDV